MFCRLSYISIMTDCDYIQRMISLRKILIRIIDRARESNVKAAIVYIQISGKEKRRISSNPFHLFFFFQISPKYSHNLLESTGHFYCRGYRNLSSPFFIIILINVSDFAFLLRILFIQPFRYTAPNFFWNKRNQNSSFCAPYGNVMNI